MLAILALLDSVLEKPREAVVGLCYQICLAALLYATRLDQAQSLHVSLPVFLPICVLDAQALLVYSRLALQALLLHPFQDKQRQKYRHIQIVVDA